jgi:beta-xylosidase
MSQTDLSNHPWVPDLGDGTYKNPIIYADYSDPDVIRVGDDFFMIASSFSHFPGLPVLHSKDLVNWKIVNHIAPKFDYPGYERPQHGKAIWAPSLRYHDGKYWMFCGFPDEGIYMSTATDPFGEWEPLHLVKKAKGLIDTCPFWDDDGQAYLVHAFANSRCGIKHKLQVCRMSPDGRSLLDDGVLVFDGTETHPTMEGPKFYKRNGYYYIFAPAGGVATGWQTVLRSRHVFGPYEDKIVLHQGDSPVNGPHQGGWVELESGESWFIHFQERGSYGRIAHLQPVHWVDDWPLMGEDSNGDGIGEPVLRYRKPNVGKTYPIEVPQTSDDFDGDKLGLQWQWQANPQSKWYSLQANPGSIRLYAAGLPEDGSTLYDAPHLLMQKFPAPEFTATAAVSFHHASAGDQAGLMIFGMKYSYLAISRTEDGQYRLTQYIGESKNDQESGTEKEIASVQVSSAVLTLRVIISGDGECRFSYSEKGNAFESIGEMFVAEEGRWVGAKVGIFAANTRSASSEGYADFDSFIIAK